MKPEDFNAAWRIGVQFEEYIGALYQKANWDVWFRGRDRKGADLGIDIVATRHDRQILVQCKYWVESRAIEAAIIETFWRDCTRYVDRRTHPTQAELGIVPPRNYRFVFVTTGSLDQLARVHAEYRAIAVRERIAFSHLTANFATAQTLATQNQPAIEENSIIDVGQLWV